MYLVPRISPTSRLGTCWLGARLFDRNRYSPYIERYRVQGTGYMVQGIRYMEHGTLLAVYL